MACQSERSPEAAMVLEIGRMLQEKLPYKTAASRIEEIERRYVTAAEGAERLALQQQAARWALIAATDRGGCFQDVSACFHRICEVGFISPHAELGVLLDFAIACGSFGYLEEALLVLEQARRRVPEWGFKNQSDLLAAIEACQQRLETGDLT
jgi:hypothetical protein